MNILMQNGQVLTVMVLEGYPGIAVNAISDEEYFYKVKEFAEGVRAFGSLCEELAYLSNYGEDCLCLLRKDFSPYSFVFTMFKQDSSGAYIKAFNGGLIYSGPGIPSNGTSPSFTVSLDEDAASGKRHMWSIHT